MYDYGRLVFLDNQKTGGTYVSVFLQSCCALEPVTAYNRHTGKVRDLKHFPVRNAYNPDTIYFSTVRHPVDLYVSLFQYGMESRGITYKRLKALGRLDLYESLPHWLEFVLDAKNAAIFREDYEQFAPLDIGLMSFRTMRITLAHPVSILGRAQSYEDMIDIWYRRNIAQHIFCQENLNASLREFATQTHPEFFHQEAVSTFFSRAERVNASTPQEGLKIPQELLARIKDKERFLLNGFYPDRFSLKTALQKSPWVRTIRSGAQALAQRIPKL